MFTEYNNGAVLYRLGSALLHSTNPLTTVFQFVSGFFLILILSQYGNLFLTL